MISKHFDIFFKSGYSPLPFMLIQFTDKNTRYIFLVKMFVSYLSLMKSWPH